jgi:acetate kinase
MQVPIESIKVGVRRVLNELAVRLSSAFKDDVQVVGHRVVHGGSLAASMILDANVKAEVKRAEKFAPLHNPAQLDGIEACEAYFRDRKQVSPSKSLLAPLSSLVSRERSY